MLTYLLIALGLAMDAFAVSVSSGICIPGLRVRHAVRAAAAFGFFQFAMPVAGWLLGATFRDLIQGFDHWIAFGLLLAVGGKMVVEFFRDRNAPDTPEACDDAEKPKRSILTWGGLLVLAVATSLDALAIGLSYSLLGTPILLPAAVIGIVTFCLSLAGCEFGRRLGARFEGWAELAGGVVLIGIGAKILVEHLVKAL